jgi:membrane protein YdbS with pleckstrin-like domain
MALGPTTAREGLRTAREVISGRQISYPVPYILVILSALCVACLVVALHATDATQTVALAIAGAAASTAILILVFAIVLRPELLRSERHEQTMRMFEIIGDRDMEPATRAQLVDRLPLEKPRGRRNSRMGDNHD